MGCLAHRVRFRLELRERLHGLIISDARCRHPIVRTRAYFDADRRDSQNNSIYVIESRQSDLEVPTPSHAPDRPRGTFTTRVSGLPHYPACSPAGLRDRPYCRKQGRNCRTRDRYLERGHGWTGGDQDPQGRSDGCIEDGAFIVPESHCIIRS